MDDDPLGHSSVWEDAPSSGTGSNSSLHNLSLPSLSEVPDAAEGPAHVTSQLASLALSETVPSLPNPHNDPNIDPLSLRQPSYDSHPLLSPATSPFADNASIVPLAPSDRDEHSDDERENSFIREGAPSPMSPAKRASETRVKRPQSSALAGGDPLGGLGPLGDVGGPSISHTGPSTYNSLGQQNGSSGPHNGETGPLNEADVEESGTGIHFQVEVSEPLKVGDVLTAYVTYKVKTKTNSPLYRNLEFSVNRRFRDFLWLYQQLVPKYPGVIIPPVPEKHAIGRFEQDFIESRRVALERFAQKVAAHPVLQNDTDLRIFLESETFLVDVNQRKKEESKGFMRAFSNALTTTTSYAKLPEFDEAFDKRKAQIETLDSQLKGLMKALEGLIRQRRELGGATMEFGDTILSLANGEANKPLAHNLTVLGSIQKKLKELHEKQARHDINHLATVVDEYIRVIGSIRIAFNSRAQAYGSWQATEANLQKKRDALEKLKTASRTRSDKIAAMSAEIEEAETQVSAAKKEFENVSTLLQKELDRCDREKVADFTAAMRAFLRSLLESQKEVIGLWESYFADTQSVRPQQSL